MIYERTYLNARIKELREALEGMDEASQMYFLAGKLLELYEFELRKYRRR